MSDLIARLEEARQLSYYQVGYPDGCGGLNACGPYNMGVTSVARSPSQLECVILDALIELLKAKEQNA